MFIISEKLVVCNRHLARRNWWCVASSGRPTRRHRYSLRQHYAVRRSLMTLRRRQFHCHPPAVCQPTKHSDDNEHQNKEKLWTTDLLRHFSLWITNEASNLQWSLLFVWRKTVPYIYIMGEIFFLMNNSKKWSSYYVVIFFIYLVQFLKFIQFDFYILIFSIFIPHSIFF